MSTYGRNEGPEEALELHRRGDNKINVMNRHRDRLVDRRGRMHTRVTYDRNEGPVGVPELHT